MIDFYTAATPNGYKVAIMLEECALPYRPHFLSLAANEQKTPDFLAINPNGRIPAIVDDGFPVFESGAILLYLAEKTGRFLSIDPQERSVAVQWLMWQMGGLGPMMGQLNVFSRYFPEKIPAAIDRYTRESYRLFRVMEARLATVPYLAGRDYGVADMAAWPLVAIHDWPGLSLDDYPNLARWHGEIAARPAVIAAQQVPPRQTDTAEGARRTVESARSILS